MSTEHEGGNAGAQQPVPADGAGAGPLPYAQERAVPADAVDDTVVQPVAPPADPTLAGFPPPVAPRPTEQPTVAAPVYPQTSAPAAPATPVVHDPYGAPAAPAAPAFPPAAPVQQAAYPADAPAYPQQPPAAPVAPAYLAMQSGEQPVEQTLHQPPYGGGTGAGDGGDPGHPGGGAGGTGGLPPYAGYPGSEYPPPGADPYGPAAPRKKRRGGLIALLAATAIVAGAVGGGIGAALESPDSSSGTTTVSTSVDPKALSRAPDSIAGIAAKALPSVVTISASNSQESGTGTGFVYDTEGHILTNNHVVAPSDNGGKLSVKFSDGTSYPATIVGRASGYDVAVIKIDGTPKKPLVPLALGNSDQVAVGDTTIAIGAPFGLSGTVTSGIISAKNRPVASGDETGAQTSYMNALQTDASINPGNSGGPLMNSSGQVIGIDSAIQSTGQSESGGQSGSIGLGFAIPINQAKWVADQLIKTGKPTYPIIGVLRDDSYQGDGAKIASAAVQGTPAVTPDGPAAKAGLQPGDVITEFGGVSIDSGPTLVSEIWSHHPGDVVSVTYTRGGKSHTTNVTLGSRVGDQ